MNWLIVASWIVYRVCGMGLDYLYSAAMEGVAPGEHTRLRICPISFRTPYGIQRGFFFFINLSVMPMLMFLNKPVLSTFLWLLGSIATGYLIALILIACIGDFQRMLEKKFPLKRSPIYSSRILPIIGILSTICLLGFQLFQISNKA